MREIGLVHTVKDGEILVKLKRHAACLGCRACSMTSTGEMLIKAIAKDKVVVGDEVAVEIDSVSVIKAIALVYLLPALGFLMGVVAGLRIASLLGIQRHKEVFSMLTGAFLLGTALFLARWYGIKKRAAYEARIAEKISS